MRLHELYPFVEEYKGRKRVGRGSGSGHGKTSGRGHKGQLARTGGSVPPRFEGGQMPLARRLPKRGFKNPFRVVYAAVNLGRLLEVFSGQASISLADIYAKGLCPGGSPVKVLGVGEVSAAVTIEAHRFSAGATAKITGAGGTIKSLEPEIETAE